MTNIQKCQYFIEVKLNKLHVFLSMLCFLQNPNIYELQQASTILAHMIGHNLGIKHDEDGE